MFLWPLAELLESRSPSKEMNKTIIHHIVVRDSYLLSGNMAIKKTTFGLSILSGERRVKKRHYMYSKTKYTDYRYKNKR